MAEKSIELRIQAAVESAEAAKSLGQLKKALLEIQTLQAEVGDTSSDNFKKLSTAATDASKQLADTRDRIGDIQDKTRTLEGTPIERLTGSFGLLKESILNLDFDKAKIAFSGFNDLAAGALDNLKGGAKGLFTSFKDGFSMLATNPLGALQSGFTGLTGGIKNLGSTFVSVGKALLTNPIFLLATAITLIVVAVVALLSKLGLLTPILDAIKAAMDAVVGAFEAFTDMLGLTSNAQDKFAENAIKNGETQRKAIKQTADEQQKLASLVEGLTEDEIKLIKERTGAQIDASKSSFQIKDEELKKTKEVVDFEIAALEQKIKDGFRLTEEQQKQLEERKAESEKINSEILQNEVAKNTAIIQSNKKVAETLKNLQLKNIADENEKNKQLLQINKEKELADIDAQILKAKKLGQNTQDLEAAKVEIEKFYSNESKKIDEKKNKEAADRYKSNISKQLKDLQDTEAAKIAKTEEGSKARLDAEISAINTVEKFQQNNRKTLGISEAQLTVIIEQNIDKRKKLQEDYYKIVSEQANKAALIAAELDTLRAKTDEEKLAAAIKLAEKQRDIALGDTKLTADERKKIELETEKSITQLKADANQKRLNDEKLASETRLSAAQFNANQTKGTLKEEINEIKNIGKLKLETLDAQRIADLSNTELTANQKAAIEEKYRQDKLTAEKETQEAITELEKAEAQKRIETLRELSGVINSIVSDGTAGISTAISAALEGVASFTEILSTEFPDTLQGTLDEINSYTQAVGDMLNSFVSATQQANQQKLDNDLQTIQTSTNAEKEALNKRFQQGLISKAQYDAAWKNLDTKAKADEEKAKKKAFEDDKKFRIASAVIAGLQGAVAAFTSAMKLGFPAGPIVGAVLAGTVAAMTATNVNKIKSQKYEGGGGDVGQVQGGGGGAPGATEGAGMGAPSAPEQPKFTPTQFFGLGQVGPTPPPPTPQVQRVFVTETDITSTQNKVKVIEDRATIG